MSFSYIIFAAMAVSMVLTFINHTEASPNIMLVNRWLRWGIFTTGAAYLLKYLGLLNGHPYWLLAIISAVVWLLLETLGSWLAIEAYSHSGLPLFPRYEMNASGELWSTQRRFLRMRDEIRAAGFKHMRSMRARIAESLHLRVSVYEDATSTTRLQVTFIPRLYGLVASVGAFSTYTASGSRYVTDNAFMPYAGFYPEPWLVERKPLMRSLIALLAHHRRRLAVNNETPQPNTRDPLEELNESQRAIEQLNIEMGFLTPHHLHDEFGCMTKAGLYRTWKERWMLNYLGRSMKYL